MSSELIHADLMRWLRGNQWQAQNGYLPRFHAVMGDPPYFLGSINKRFGKPGSAPAQYGADGSFRRLTKGFMGKSWDGFDSVWEYQAWVTEWAALLLDYVYPGAVLALFGGTRTYHRLAAGLEDAGWELFDSVLAWNYGSGFPKAADIGKLIDKKAGADRQVVGGGSSGKTRHVLNAANTPETFGGDYDVTAPATVEAARWDGFKTALKPAYEPIVLARAPRGTLGYADLALRFGTGALNVDNARIGTSDKLTHGGSLVASPADIRNGAARGMFQPGTPNTFMQNDGGRYPANMALICACTGYEHAPDCPVAVLDGQSGESSSGAGVITRAGGYGRQLEGRTDKPDVIPDGLGFGDSGGASRFFYTAKSPSWEREAGLEAFAATTVTDGRETPIDNAYQRGETVRRNTHPTVKPIQLAEWLARLLLPAPLDEPRRILIPFAGVASEMIGAHFAGWDQIVGIEREAEYIPLNVARRAFWEQFASYEAARKLLNIPDVVIPQGQMSIFDYLDE